MIAFKLAAKELNKNIKFSLFFILTLAAGFTGFVIVDSLKISIDKSLSTRAKGILAADIGVGSRREFTEDELAVVKTLIPAGSLTTSVFESYTMLASQTNSRLVELKAIENGYPFYGEIFLNAGGLIQFGSELEILTEPRIWVYPELLLQLELKVGDKIQIGDQDFIISDTVLRDSSGVGGGFTFAPPVYIGKNFFGKTGLKQKGSTGYHSHLFKTPETTDIKALANELNEKLKDPAIRVFTSENASEQVGRLLAYLSDYLGLSGLVALFLTVIGQIFLYRSYLSKRNRDIAILKSLGFNNFFIFRIYLTQLLLLGFAALVPILGLAKLLMPLLQGPIKNLVNIDITLQLHASTIWLLMVATVFGLLLVCGPLLFKALKTKPIQLLYLEENRNSSSLSTWFHYLPALIVYYTLSVWLTKSYYVGGLFFGMFLSSIILLAGVGYILLNVFSKIKIKNTVLRLAIRNASRERFASLAAFVAISMGVLLASLIPSLEAGIKSEITSPENSEVPSLFLIDIQNEQIDSLKIFLQKQNIDIMQTSPMIRAKLSSVNNVSFEKGTRPGESFTREEENENRFRNRGFNLTYRDKITPSEKIIAQLSSRKNDPSAPEISLEQRFANRLNLKLGDKMTFDIQGVEFDGIVSSIRKIRWTSFQPNFFIQFNDGDINEAPKTYLVTLKTSSVEEKLTLQTQIVKAFPNISILDVTRLIERLTEIISQMGFALMVMAIFTVFVGFIVLFSIASHKTHEKRQEVNLYKILGADFYKIQFLFLIDFLSMVSLASACGIAISQAISFSLAHFLFDASYKFNASQVLLLFLAVNIVSSIVSLVAVNTVLKVQPRELLQS